MENDASMTCAPGTSALADNCAKCHSSKRPPAGLQSDELKAWYRESVLADDFLDNNFLSEDRRHSIAALKTNAGRAVATNAKRGRIWDNFSSETYKELRAVKSVKTYNLLTEEYDYTFDLENRVIEHSLGYYRTPSLIAIWTSAPFLHNNTLGKYPGDPSVNRRSYPSVNGRLEVFEDAAKKLLWPELRDNVIGLIPRRIGNHLDLPTIDGVVALEYMLQRRANRRLFIVSGNNDGDRRPIPVVRRYGNPAHDGRELQQHWIRYVRVPAHHYRRGDHGQNHKCRRIHKYQALFTNDVGLVRVQSVPGRSERCVCHRSVWSL